MGYKIIAEIDQQSEQWFSLRAGRVTASQAKRILTPTGKQSTQAKGYMAALVAETFNPQRRDFEGNKDTERGNELEPEAADLYALMHPQYDVRKVAFVGCEDMPVGCSPDRLLYDANGNLVAGLEIKCSRGENHVEIFLEGTMPSEHKPQVHLSMGIMGIPWYFMQYAQGMNPLIVKCYPDEFTAQLMLVVKDFVVQYQAYRAKVVPLLRIKQSQQHDNE